jgi:DNA-binding transcriptional ArsR family regulator
VKAAARDGDPLEALGNAYRREIVEILSRKPRSVQEIADRLPISRPAVSRHLSVLTRARLVSDEQVGTRRLYRLERTYLTQVWSDVATRFKLFAENTQARRRH